MGTGERAHYCEPLQGEEWHPLPPKPTLTPTDTEVAIILETAEGDDLKAVLALTAYCALRPQEVLGLRRKDVGSVERGDETRWVVTVARALSWLKGGEVVT